MRDHQLYREIDALFEDRRAQNRTEEARRFSEASGRDPRIGELFAARTRLFQEQARAAFANPAQALQISQTLGLKIDALQKEMKNRLSALGLPEDYLQPVYQCAQCRDTGYVGEPLRERCACYLRAAQAVRYAGGQGVDPRESFLSYDDSVYDGALPLPGKTPDTQRAYMERVRALCEAYCAQFPRNERRNLLFTGPSGLGKTFLLNCIGNAVAAQGHSVIKLTAYQLSERTRASIFGNDPEAFSVLLEAPLLLLDDLGAEPMINNITVEQLYTLLSERLLSGLHTVISTNLLPEELQGRYTERIFSRLFDRRNATVLAFKGSDVRLR